MPRPASPRSSNNSRPPVTPRYVAPPAPAAPPALPAQGAIGRPTFGQAIKEGIASGFGASIGMRLASAIGFGPQVSVKHESVPAPAPAPVSTPVPVVEPSILSAKQKEYKECIEFGHSKETCENWVLSLE